MLQKDYLIYLLKIMKTEIQTAEDLLLETSSDVYAEGPVYSESGWSYELVKKLMIDYAKLHCKAQLEAIFEEVKKERLVTDAGIAYLERAYNLDNIK